MKKLSASAMELLAAKYVLGLLPERVKRRFEQHMVQSLALRQEVWFWERKLQPLALRVEPVAPPKSSWPALEQRLWKTTKASATETPSRWSWFWQGWSLLATAAALVLALTPGLQPQQDTSPQWLAVVQSAQSEPLWLVDANTTSSQVRLKAVAAPAATVEQDFELWLLPKSGNPVSVGLLPREQDEVTITLTRSALLQLLENRALGISLEPRGGSPTGQPTGPVLYQSRLLEL